MSHPENANTNTLAALLLVCCMAGPGNAHASPVVVGAFGPGAVVESFEGITPGPNILQTPGNGILKVGVTGPYTSSSGVTLTHPLPSDPPPSGIGVLVNDFRLGSASFGLPGMA